MCPASVRFSYRPGLPGNLFLVVGNLSNAPFPSGYWIHCDRIGNASWTEVFNGDSEAYGGWNIGNAGATLHGSNGALNVVLPAAGLVVFRRSDLNTNGLRS